MSQPRLVCITGPLAGHSFPIGDRSLLLGRAQEADVRLEDPDVSRFHAEVRVLNGAIWVQDRGSRNGVFVNDRRVTSSKSVGPGDRVAVGMSVFTIEIPEERTEEVTLNLGALAPAATPAPTPPSRVPVVVGALVLLALLLAVVLLVL